MKQIVSIVEDSLPFQAALVDIINRSDCFALGKVYGSAEAAVQMLKQTPDIAIVDIQLPGKDGIELIAQLHAARAGIKCLVCSLHDDDERIFRALESGAVGYILKESSVQQISDALHELLIGGAPMSPYIARRVIAHFKKPMKVAIDTILTDREIEVLQLLSKGHPYKVIADELFISVETVKKHLRNVYLKLQVTNKVEAINKYQELL